MLENCSCAEVRCLLPGARSFLVCHVIEWWTSSAVTVFGVEFCCPRRRSPPVQVAQATASFFFSLHPQNNSRHPSHCLPGRVKSGQVLFSFWDWCSSRTCAFFILRAICLEDFCVHWIFVTCGSWVYFVAEFRVFLIRAYPVRQNVPFVHISASVTSILMPLSHVLLVISTWFSLFKFSDQNTLLIFHLCSLILLYFISLIIFGGAYKLRIA
jgi:hypothetical protein